MCIFYIHARRLCTWSMLMLWRAFAFLEMKKKGHSHSRPLFALSAPQLQNISAGKRFIYVSCTVHVPVWKVILYSQVAEQTSAKKKGSRNGEGKDAERVKGGRRRYNKGKKGDDSEQKEGNEERRKKSLGVSSQQHVKLLSRLLCTHESKEVTGYSNTPLLPYFYTHWKVMPSLKNQTVRCIQIKIKKNII